VTAWHGLSEDEREALRQWDLRYSEKPPRTPFLGCRLRGDGSEHALDEALWRVRRETPDSPLLALRRGRLHRDQLPFSPAQERRAQLVDAWWDDDRLGEFALSHGAVPEDVCAAARAFIDDHPETTDAAVVAHVHAFADGGGFVPWWRQLTVEGVVEDALDALPGDEL
jgi:hypothetical protein